MKRSRQTYAVAVGLVLAVSGAALAEEKTAQMGEMVVTATRDEVPIEQVGSSITVITSREIEQQQKTNVADLLRTVPGLDVKSNYGPGSLTEVYLRGAKPGHTLVLIDGVEANDPSDAGGSFNFGNLTADSIERIEVLSGPQSTLYGSQAIGGVINIITKRGDGPMQVSLSAEGGSHATARETAGIQGSIGRFQYLARIARLDTNGISAANRANGNPENDPYQNTTVTTRLGAVLLSNLDLEATLRYSRSRTDQDGYPPPRYALADLLGYYSKTDQLYLRSEGNLSLLDGLWHQKLGVSYNDSKRDYSDGYHYHGQSVKVDWQHIVRLHRTNEVTLGAEHKEEYAESTGMSGKHAATTSVYLQDQLRLFDRWFSTLGFRVDDHSAFGTEVTWRFTSAYLFRETGTKIRASYGSGFQSPTLYQLNAPPYPPQRFVGGNPSLKPEKSTGWDVGLEQNLPFMHATIGATWFRNDLKDMISYLKNNDTANYYYGNTAKARSQGLELTVGLQPVDGLALKAAYTYTETQDDTAGSSSYGKQWTYRPKNKVSFDANYSFLKKANLNLGLIYVGTRYADTANKQKMKDYLLVNLAGSYDLTKNLQLFGRVDNLFDRQYEEVAGYGTPGIGAYGGVKVSF